MRVLALEEIEREVLGPLEALSDKFPTYGAKSCPEPREFVSVY